MLYLYFGWEYGHFIISGSNLGQVGTRVKNVSQGENLVRFGWVGLESLIRYSDHA